MAVSIELRPGTEVSNTNGTRFTILSTTRPNANYPVIGMDIQSGEVQFFDLGGGADTPLHANLVLEISQIPPNDINPGLQLQSNTLYRTRNGTKVRVENPSTPGKFKVKQADNFFDFFGYEVWNTGMRKNSGTDPTDIIELYQDPLQLWTYAVILRDNPLDITKWSMSSSKPTNLKQGEVAVAVHIREPITPSQTFTLHIVTQ